MNINVCVSSNHSYVKYLYVMLSSLFECNRNDEFSVFVLERDLTENDKTCLLELASKWKSTIKFEHIDVSVFEPIIKQGIGDYPAEALFRFCILDTLPEIDRVLYLDVDVLIRHPIREFYTTDFEGNLFVACEDLYMTLDEYRQEMFHRSEGKYFNSGVMLWNLDALRKEITIDIFFKGAKELRQKLVCADQEVLNYLFYDRIKWQDSYKYNYLVQMDNTRGYDYRQFDPVIIHFAGVNPWKPGRRSEAYMEWWEYVDRTPYKNEIYSEYRSRVDQCVTELINENDNLGEINNRLYKDNSYHWYLYGVYRSLYYLDKENKQVACNNNTIIYGAGKLGIILLDKIKQAGDRDKIVAFIDSSKRENIEDVPVYDNVNEFDDEMYTIIVTPAKDNDAIINEIKSSMKKCKNIISLREYLDTQLKMQVNHG